MQLQPCCAPTSSSAGSSSKFNHPIPTQPLSVRADRLRAMRSIVSQLHLSQPE